MKKFLALSPLQRSDLPKDAVALARFLLGQLLVRELGVAIAVGRIVETEAYLPSDPASHSYRGESSRNRSMFGERGHAYVYRIYGLWHCFNVTAGVMGEGAAVLVRALEPLQGMDLMARRRADVAVQDLARGPGRLCTALAITVAQDGIDLCAGRALWLSRGPGCSRVGVSARIGVSKAPDAPLRFYERGNAFVSGKRALRD